jgi:hypothetical protein
MGIAPTGCGWFYLKCDVVTEMDPRLKRSHDLLAVADEVLDRPRAAAGHEDALQGWQRQMSKPKAAPVAVEPESIARDQSMSREQQAAWDAWAKRHIEIELAKLKKQIIDVLGQVIARERKDRRAELEQALARKTDDATVIDVSKLIGRRKDAA